ncbi:MAG: DUF4959 domain-containing protein [Marinifilaceae bacterium]
MKNIFLLLPMLMLLWACEKDEVINSSFISSDNITFRPIAGGAVMYYNLPDSEDARSIKVQYTDAQGQQLTRVGSYFCDSLVIIGFNEARKHVEAQVSMVYKDETESEKTKVFFDTHDSGAYSFCDNARIDPFWYGFSLIYDAPENSKGLAHVYYLGLNPLTNKRDTLRIDTFVITPGSDTLNYILKQIYPENTVIVRTEDYRGYTVREKVWDKVSIYNSTYLSADNFDFYSPDDLIIEDDLVKLSAKYLFDQDCKGLEVFTKASSSIYYTFVAGPYAVGKPFIFDFKDQPRIPAYLNFHSMLNVNKYGNLHPWGAYYMYNRTPNSIDVFASNDVDDDESWVKIGSYHQSKTTQMENRWSYRGPGYGLTHKINNIEEFDAAEPCKVTIHFPPSKESYRYLKVIFNETFDKYTDVHDGNINDYVTLHEIEVFVKQDD